METVGLIFRVIVIFVLWFIIFRIHSHVYHIRQSLKNLPSSEKELVYERALILIESLYPAPDFDPYKTAYPLASVWLLSRLEDQNLKDVVKKLNNEEWGTIRDRLADGMVWGAANLSSGGLSEKMRKIAVDARKKFEEK